MELLEYEKLIFLGSAALNGIGGTSVPYSIVYLRFIENDHLCTQSNLFSVIPSLLSLL